MTNPERINEAYVNDGKGDKKLVKPDDNVDLLPVDLMEPDEEDGHYFNKKRFDSLRDSLGEGPYKISWIGLWPCGRVMLYIDTSKKEAKGVGIRASVFMSID